MVYVDVYIEYNALQLNQTFTYHCQYPVSCGCRVKVPFSSRTLIGYVQSIHSSCDLESVKDVLEVLDTKPILNEELMNLADWMSTYYVSSKMSCLKTMVPPALKPSHKHAKIVTLDWLETTGLAPKTKRQEAFLAANTFPILASELRKQSVFNDAFSIRTEGIKNC